MVSLMPHRRRQVFVDTPRGRRRAGFTVPETADAADVSMTLRERGWAPYRLHLDSEQHAWIAVVIDWQHPPDFVAKAPSAGGALDMPGSRRLTVRVSRMHGGQHRLFD